MNCRATIETQRAARTWKDSSQAYASLVVRSGLITILLFVGSKSLAATAPVDRKALILYDGSSTGYSEGLISSRSIANLLGHFSVSYDIQSVADYQPASAENYTWIFFAGNSENTRLPKVFLDDLAATSKTVCWLNRHVDQLLSNPSCEQSWLFPP